MILPAQNWTTMLGRWRTTFQCHVYTAEMPSMRTVSSCLSTIRYTCIHLSRISERHGSLARWIEHAKQIWDYKKLESHIATIIINVQMPIDTPATNPFCVLHQKENPVISKQTAIQGNVNSSRFLDRFRESWKCITDYKTTIPSSKCINSEDSR